MKLFKIPLVAVLFFTTFVSTVFAQLPPDESGKAVNDVVTESILPPHPYPTLPSNPIFGQDHSYSVVFRGNGEAVVTLKVIFTNTSSSVSNRIYLRVPKVEPKEILAYQIYKPETCIRYTDYPNRIAPTPGYDIDYTCEEYNKADYYGGYFGDASYYKARTDYSGDTLTIYLPKSVRADSSGALFVYFRAFGYAKKDLIGGFNYTFETLKANESIRNLTVGISTDSELYLKDAKGEVNYRFDEASLAPLSEAQYGVALTNPKVTNFVSGIGRGTVTKTASNLASLESYTIKGVYADSKIKLYQKEIFYGLVVLLLLVAGFWFTTRFVYKRLHSMKLTKEEKTDKIQDNFRSGVIIAAVTFFSPLLMVAYTFALILLSSSRMFNYGYDYLGAVLFIIVVILSIAVYGVLLFFPALYVGLKKGLHWALATFLMTVFWVAFYVFVIVVILSIFGQNSRVPVIF